MHHIRHRTSGGAVALACCLITMLGVAASAQAATPVPFTITETVNFSDGQPPGGTFTATGPICPLGTWVDNARVVAPNPDSAGIDHKSGVNLLVNTVYTCSDGTGTINALKHVFFSCDDSGCVNTGDLQLLGGTGAFSNTIGHGVDNGSTATGQGLITGFVTQP